MSKVNGQQIIDILEKKLNAEVVSIGENKDYLLITAINGIDDPNPFWLYEKKTGTTVRFIPTEDINLFGQLQSNVIFSKE